MTDGTVIGFLCSLGEIADPRNPVQFSQCLGIRFRHPPRDEIAFAFPEPLVGKLLEEASNAEFAKPVEQLATTDYAGFQARQELFSQVSASIGPPFSSQTLADYIERSLALKASLSWASQDIALLSVRLQSGSCVDLFLPPHSIPGLIGDFAFYLERWRK